MRWLLFKRNLLYSILFFIGVGLVMPEVSFAKAEIDLVRLAQIECAVSSSHSSVHGPELKLRKIKDEDEWGPSFRVPASAKTRSIQDMKTFSIGQYNTGGMLERRGELHRFPELQKFASDPSLGAEEKLNVEPEFDSTQERIEGVARNILRANSDVVVLEEVQNLTLLRAFNERHLESKYKTILIPGNDPNERNIAFLIKRDLPFDLEVQSYKNVSYAAKNEPIFTRDLPVVLFREKGSGADSQPLMAIFGTHFKARKGPLTDPFGIVGRRAQADATVEIMKFYEKKYGKDMPMFLAGDFNNDVTSSPEFKSLWERLGLSDAFDESTSKSPSQVDQQFTHSYLPEKNSPRTPEFLRMDAIAISPVVQENRLVTHAEILRDLDKKGKPRPAPKTKDERKTFPSDHRMINIQFNFERILQRFRKLQRFRAYAY